MDWLRRLRVRGNKRLKRRRYYPDADSIFRQLRLMQEEIAKIAQTADRARKEAHAAREAVSLANRAAGRPAASAQRSRLPRPDGAPENPDDLGATFAKHFADGAGAG
jgi:hypothetical protein